MTSKDVGNVGFCQDQRLARNPHNALIGTAAGTRRQMRHGLRRDIFANDGEVSGIEFEDVWAALQTRSEGAIRMRIGTESFVKHARR